MENSGIKVAFIKSSKQENLDKVKPSEIQLSNEHFMRNIKFHKKYENWLEKDIFPPDETLAKTASLSYDDSPDRRITDVCPGWTVLTTAHNPKDAYFGAAYFNRETQQLIIAHRGTKLGNSLVRLADIEGIVLNRHTSQINSACTFAAFLLSQFKGHPVQISFTGHSLGAWLAQITTFSTEYLTIDESGDYFRVKPEEEDDHHAHAVTFDSPGCMRMLSKMSENYFPRYLHRDYDKWATLDITNYLTSPNLINICNKQVGTLLQLTVQAPSKWHSCWLLYTKHYHSRIKIVEAMAARNAQVAENETGGEAESTKTQNEVAKTSYLTFLLNSILSSLSLGYFREFSFGKKSENEPSSKEVIEPKVAVGTVKVIHSWPTIDVPEEMIKDDQPLPPSSYFFSHLRTLKNIPSLFRAFMLVDNFEYKKYFQVNYNKSNKDRVDDCTVEVGDDKLHFGLGDFDGKVCNFNVFSEREKVFVSSWLELKKQGVLSEKQRAIVERLKGEGMLLSGDGELMANFEMKDGANVCCQCESDLKMVVNGVKQLFRLLPPAVTKRMNQELAEESETDRRICESVSKNSAQNLVKNEYKFRDLIGLQEFFESDKMIFLLRVESVSHLEISRIFSLSKEKILFLNLSDLRHLSKFLDLAKTFARFSKHLIVLDAESSESNDFVTDLLNRILNKNLICKLIVVINGELDAGFINQNSIFIRESSLNFSSFCLESQNLLREKIIRLQGREFQLCQLIDDGRIDNLDLPTIETLANNQVLDIGGKSEKICEIKQFRLQFEEIIDKNSLINLLKFSSNETKILISSGTQNIQNFDQFLTALNCDDEGEKNLLETSINNNKLKLNFDENETNYFDTLCRENSNSKVYRLQINSSTEAVLILKEVYSGDLFFQQNFNKISEIPYNVIRRRLVEENPPDIFTFRAQNLNDLSKHFRLTIDEEKPKFDLNVKNKNILLNSTEKSASKKNVGKNQELKPVYNVINSWPIVSSSDDDAFWSVEHEIRSDEKFVFLSDEPGMGKSIKLVEMSEKMSKIGWVLRVNLLANQANISDLRDISLNSIIDSLTQIFDCDYPELLRELLRYRLDVSGENSEPIFILCDGFDEIDESAQNKVLELLVFLKKETLARVWVTTRTDHRRALEKRVFGFSASLDQFSVQRQKVFLINFWNISSYFEENFDEKRIENYADEVLREAKVILGNESDKFLGNPLHVRMLAEVMLKVVKESLFSQSEKLHIRRSHHLQSLFRGFIGLRFDEYFRQNLKLNSKFAISHVQPASFQSFRKLHGLLALRSLFPLQFSDFFKHRSVSSQLKGVADLDERLSAVRHVGLIKLVNGKFQFIYQILADYFLADLLLNWWQKYNPQHPRYLLVDRFLFDVILLEVKCSFIRKFIEKRLKN